MKRAICEKCGETLLAAEGWCPSCSPVLSSASFAPASAQVNVVAQPVGILTRKVEDGVHSSTYHSPDGAKSSNTLSPDTFSLHLAGRSDAGKPGEATVVHAVETRLRETGYSVTRLTASDGDGEDARVLCDDIPVTIQVTMVPHEPGLWEQWRHGSTSTEVPLPTAVGWVKKAVDHKANRYSAPEKEATILALDVRHLGALVSPPFTEAIAAECGDVPSTSGFGAVWLVGATSSTCTALGEGKRFMNRPAK
jgi:hypothetical protein